MNAAAAVHTPSRRRVQIALAAFGGAGLLAGAASLIQGGPAWPYLGGSLALALGAGALAMHPTLGFWAPVIVGGRPGQGRLALSFDDGPCPATPGVLEVLAQHRTRATFFVIGERVERDPAGVARLVEAGHEIGCHSFSHGRLLGFWSAEQVRADLERAVTALERLEVPRPRLYRAPHGVVSPPLARAVREAGMELCAWTARAFDGIGRPSPARMLARLTPAIADGAILALHDRAARDALPELLERVAACGLAKVPIGELIGLSAAT